jgi:hypothetical protein
MAGQSARDSRDVVHLMNEVDRYRTATEDALQQLDWCIGYFVGSNKKGLAKALGANRAHIQSQIRQKPIGVPTDSEER